MISTTDQRRTPVRKMDEASVTVMEVRCDESLSLADDEIWEPWFAFPSERERGLTLLRWAEETKVELLNFAQTLLHVDRIAMTGYQMFQTLCRRTNSAYKLLILGSILLIRGVQHGTQMGRMLFGTLLGERLNDLVLFRHSHLGRIGPSEGVSVGLMQDVKLLSLPLKEARALHLRAEQFHDDEKYTAALEHLGMALLKLVPWNCSSLPSVCGKVMRDDYVEMDQTILIFIARTSTALARTLPPSSRTISTTVGSRLYRLSHAACELVQLFAQPPPVFPPSPSIATKTELLDSGSLDPALPPTPPLTPPPAIPSLQQSHLDDPNPILTVEGGKPLPFGLTSCGMSDIIRQSATLDDDAALVAGIQLGRSDQYDLPDKVRRIWELQQIPSSLSVVSV